MITQERVRELFTYEPSTGSFTRRVHAGKARAGSIAGTLRSDGYLSIPIDCQMQHAHRLAWLYMTGDIPVEIDHINGNRSDNRWANLRAVDRAANMQNQARAHSKNRTSGVLGVSGRRTKRGWSWRANIQVNGQATSLGSFPTIEAARLAYLDAKRQLHPYGARL